MKTCNFNVVIERDELIEDGEPLPEGPKDAVEVEEISKQEQPRIAVTVSHGHRLSWPAVVNGA